jgi:hypothetical protein
VPDKQGHPVAHSILPKKKPRGVNGGAKFSFSSKEVAANSVNGCDGFLLYLDVDLLFLLLFFFWRLNPVSIRFCYRPQLHFAWADNKKQDLCQPR